MNLEKYQRWIPGFEGKYFATEGGQIFHVFPSGKLRELKGYKKGNLYEVKLDRKAYLFNRIIWETFKGPIPKGFVVTRKLNILSVNALYNLQIKSSSKHAKKTGALARSQSVIQMNDEGEIVNSWTSARKAGKDLFISGQTVMDYCNKKVKKPIFNLRWEGRVVNG